MKNSEVKEYLGYMPVVECGVQPYRARAPYGLVWELMSLASVVMVLLLGEMADELLLKGQKVLPQKALNTKYTFQYEDISPAINQILGRK